MRTDVQRNAKYTSKYVAGTVNLKVAARLDGMKTEFATACAALYAKEVAIQGILNAVGGGIPTTLYPFYLAFGREVWALTWKGVIGTSLDAAAQVYHDKWEASGLTSAVLIDIAALMGATVT